jgi:micrococcal nuclease
MGALVAPRAASADVPPEESALYFYKAKITDVYDADTVTADVDLGFYVWLHEQKFRLYGINATEVKGEKKKAGKKCRDMLAAQISGKEVLIQSIKNPKEKDKKEKYGRWLAVIWHNGVNMNEWVVAQNCGVHAEY